MDSNGDLYECGSGVFSIIAGQRQAFCHPAPCAIRRPGGRHQRGARSGGGRNENHGPVWHFHSRGEIGRASCRERAWLEVGAARMKKKEWEREGSEDGRRESKEAEGP